MRMKVTIETDLIAATVEYKPEYDRFGYKTEAQRTVELIKCALLAIGYQPQTVKEMLNEDL